MYWDRQIICVCNHAKNKNRVKNSNTDIYTTFTRQSIRIKIRIFSQTPIGTQYFKEQVIDYNEKNS